MSSRALDAVIWSNNNLRLAPRIGERVILFLTILYYLWQRALKRAVRAKVSDLHVAATHEVAYPQFVFFNKGALSPGRE
jgi:hypothetical protein